MNKDKKNRNKKPKNFKSIKRLIITITKPINKFQQQIISSKATGSMSAVFVEVGSFVDVSQVFAYYLLCKQLLLGNCSQWLLQWFKYNFRLILHGMKVFERALFVGAFFVKHLVLCRLFIKHQFCFGNLARFPSQITNLLAQYFY